MKKTKNFFAAMLIMVLSGCAAYYPQAVDIPLIKEKGDLKVDAGGFVAPSVQGEGAMVGGHSTFSYGITDILAGQMYVSFDFAGRTHFQIAPGVFKGFENKSVIEFYGGYGFGRAFWDDNFYQLVFNQFNVGKVGKNFEYGLGLKGGYIFTYENEFTNKVHQTNGWIAEPSAMIRLGGEKVKFKTQINYLWTKTISDNYYLPLSVSMGINIYFNTF